MLFPTLFDDQNALKERDDDFARELRSFYKDFLGNPRPLRQMPMMKTDVKEFDDKYELTLDLPGMTKDDVEVSLDNGYLTISAEKKEEKEEKDKKTGNIIRSERYTGMMRRDFYVGEDVKEEEIKGKLENGVLKLDIPKKKEEEKQKDIKKIAIE